MKVNKLEIEGGTLFYWFDDQYKTLISAGENKKELERSLIIQFLHSIYPECELIHREGQAPIIRNTPYKSISVSHYKGWFACVLSQLVVGVDIQPFKKNLWEGRHYFITDLEEEQLELSNLNLHLIWAAKEAFYKFKLGEMEDLKNEVEVSRIDIADNKLYLYYEKEEYSLDFKVNDEMVLVWVNK